LKIYVISDTHGKTDKAISIYGRLSAVDMIIHLGDIEKDAKRIAEAAGKTVVSVRGNNDFLSAKEEYLILETEYGKILLTHGHLFNVKSGLQKLFYRTLELDCKAVMFGHTHVPVFTESNGVYFLNPGSLTYPSDGTAGSYAIVNTSAGFFSASIVYYKETAP